jgi:hypothetical protein
VEALLNTKGCGSPHRCNPDSLLFLDALFNFVGANLAVEILVYRPSRDPVSANCPPIHRLDSDPKVVYAIFCTLIIVVLSHEVKL